MWTHLQHKASPETRAIRIAIVLALAVSLGGLFLHTHAGDDLFCPQCVLLAGLVLPFVALLLSPPRVTPVRLRPEGDTAPRAQLSWSRRLLRGPPSAR